MRISIRGRLESFALVSAVAGLSVALGTIASANTSDEPEADRAPQHIYDRTCGYCHGHNVGPIILGRDLQPAIVEYFVRHGNGAMPAFKPTEISPSELTALAEWISQSEADAGEYGQ